MAILFSVEFIIMALFINVIIFIIFNGIKNIITKGKGDNVDKGWPEVIIRNIMMIAVFIIAFLLTWFLVTTGQIILILNSIFLTSAWCATLSTITYNVGIKDIMGWFTEIIRKKLEK